MPALVLIAESDPFNLRLLQEICEAAGHTVLTAMDGGSALEVVARKRPDLVLVDVGLPSDGDGDAAIRAQVLASMQTECGAGMRETLPEVLDDDAAGGLEVLRLLKSDQRLSSIPVLLTANDRDERVWRRGIELGAEDYLSRPYRVFEIHQRVRNTLRRALLERMQTNDSIEDAHRAGSPTQLPLTLDYEMTRAVRFGHALACVTVGCSNLEHIRDAAGNEAVGLVMNALLTNVRQCVRTIDHVFQAGAREVVLVLPETSASEAEVVVHRIEQRARQGLLAPMGGRARAEFVVGVAGRIEGNHACGLELLVAAQRARRRL
jgi:PleD family two-component response regulator